MDELLADYRHALSLYTAADFEEFFRLAEIRDRVPQDLAIDIIGVAGAFYLSERRAQSTRLTRSEVLRRLGQARKASTKLSEALPDLLDNGALAGKIQEAALLQAEARSDELPKDSDAYRILNQIFPLDATGKGFRISGLMQSLDFLAATLSSVEPDDVRKPKHGRRTALRPWASLMHFAWHELKGDFPRLGHYDTEAADYGSPDVSALTSVAAVLDREISERLVVESINNARADLLDETLRPVTLLGTGVAMLLFTGTGKSSPEALAAFVGMPAELAREHWATDPSPRAKRSKDRAMLSKQEFFEMLFRQK